MVRYLPHSELDKNKWDVCIEHATYPIIYGYSWYLDVICPGWDALIEGDYESVFPLTWKRKFGIYYLTQPYFAQQLGIFSMAEMTPDKMQDFFNAVPKKFLHYDIMLNPQNVFQMNGKLHSDVRKTYHVPLHYTYDKIYGSYSGDTKRNLKRNANKNLAVQKINAEEIIELYKKNVWRKTPGVTLDNYETLRKLVNEIENKNTRQCRTLGVFENNELCAGGIFLISDKKIIFLFGAANRTGRKNAAMRFLFDRMIKQYCRKNYVLDFEGSCINTVEYFYKGFGPHKVTFLNVHFNRFRVLDYSIAIKQKLSKMVLKMFL